MGLWNLFRRFVHWLWHGSGHDIDELARRLGVEPAELLGLEPRYRTFTIPKRSGGERRVSEPEPPLKTMQRRLLRRLLKRLRCHPAATGFQPGQSIVTHARQHAGMAVVVRLDVKDFFPSTGAGRVYRYFRRIGWNRPASRLLTRLCTHEGGLPQGAPTSPRLSNLVNYLLDRRLSAMAARKGLVYSRYADDITLSFPSDERLRIRRMIGFVARVAAEHGYTLHGRKKLRIRRQHQQQRVTGLVVNERVNLPRKTRRWLRAVEHHLRTGWPATLTPAQLAGWKAVQQMVAGQSVVPPETEALRDLLKLQGTWIGLPADRQEKPEWPAILERTQKIRWTIRDTKVLIELGECRVEAALRLDASASPRRLDLTPDSGPDRGKTTPGIYRLHRGVLTVCLGSLTDGRPTEFVFSPGAEQTLLVLRRKER